MKRILMIAFSLTMVFALVYCAKVKFVSAGRVSTLEAQGSLDVALEDNVCTDCDEPIVCNDDDPAEVEVNEEDSDKVLICHVPPGNHAAAHVISIGQPAVKAHLNHSGDSLDWLIAEGSEAAVCEPCDANQGLEEER